MAKESMKAREVKGLSRVMFREMANKGLIPGVRKASW